MRFRHAAACILALGVVMTTVAAQDEKVYTPEDGVTLPVLVKNVKPNYTHEAMQQRIEGTVVLAVVVRADGTVGEVQVVESLDSVYGLDNEAIKSVKQYEFKPGTKDGKPVAVRVKIAIRFTLR